MIGSDVAAVGVVFAAVDDDDVHDEDEAADESEDEDDDKEEEDNDDDAEDNWVSSGSQRCRLMFSPSCGSALFTLDSGGQARFRTGDRTDDVDGETTTEDEDGEDSRATTGWFISSTTTRTDVKNNDKNTYSTSC
jgi:hypothetical protein